MILDNENQRQILLAGINAANWQGSVIEEIVKVKIAIVNAAIAESPKKKE